MSDHRYVIAKALRASGEFLWAMPVLDLPDAPPSLDGSQHIHVTRHPDGTITAVPLELYHVILRDNSEGFVVQSVPTWVDTPRGETGEQTGGAA